MSDKGNQHYGMGLEPFFLMFLRLNGESLPDRGWAYKGVHHA